ncbi:MAG: inosine/xanthosine triphosphatase [Candidatus Anstonellales archaeon]
MKTAVLGGTFDTIHNGHHKLFVAAKGFQKLVVGLTTDTFANSTRNYTVKPYSQRKMALVKYLSSIHPNFSIIPLSDRFGISTTSKDIDAIIVSEETEPVAQEINSIRKKRGLPALSIICVPLKFAFDYKKLSAEFIHMGKTDNNGNRLSKVTVALGSTNPTKIKSTTKALKLLLNNFLLKAFSVHSRVPAQPFSLHTIRGAINRAVSAYNKMNGKADFGIGLESGLFRFGSSYHDILFCAVWDGMYLTIGNSMGFALPQEIVQEIKSTKSELGAVVSTMSKIQNIGKKGGAISYLSGGLLTREQMIEQAVLCAFVPRIHKAIH